MSAQDALLARLVLSGKADQEQKWRFARVAFGSRCRWGSLPVITFSILVPAAPSLVLVPDQSN